MKRHVIAAGSVLMILLTAFAWRNGYGESVWNFISGENTAEGEAVAGGASEEAKIGPGVKKAAAEEGAEEKNDGEEDVDGNRESENDGKETAGENRENENDGEETGVGSGESFGMENETASLRQVALTFDDGPHAIYTPLLLDGLKERGVKATFFLMGQNIEGNEEIVKRMSEEGHLIGNHTYSHVQLTAVSEAEALADVEKDSRLIESITGATVACIRPPYGSVTQSLAEKMNLRIVLWDIDPRDWESQNAALVVKHILNHIGDGEIILLHDIFRSSVEAALTVIDELTAQGYEFVRVDELGMYE